MYLRLCNLSHICAILGSYFASYGSISVSACCKMLLAVTRLLNSVYQCCCTAYGGLPTAPEDRLGCKLQPDALREEGVSCKKSAFYAREYFRVSTLRLRLKVVARSPNS